MNKKKNIKDVVTVGLHLLYIVVMMFVSDAVLVLFIQTYSTVLYNYTVEIQYCVPFRIVWFSTASLKFISIVTIVVVSQHIWTVKFALYAKLLYTVCEIDM